MTKSNTFITILTLQVLFLASLAGCAENEQEQIQQQGYEMQLQQQMVETSDSFRNDLSKLLDHYFQLKEHFVSSEAEESKIAAELLVHQTEAVNTGDLNEETEMLWGSFAEVIIISGEQLGELNDIDEQRIYFEEISDAVIQITETFRPVGYEVYIQSCPMVRGESAEWLSREEEIKNPYHGDRMLNCGEVLRSI